MLALFYHLTANGADIEAVSSVKQTALHLAASGNNDVLLKRLIEFCANINAVDIDGCTALHYAAFNERDDMVKLLIDSGIDVYKSKQSK